MKVLQTVVLFLCFLSVLSQDAGVESSPPPSCDCTAKVNAAEVARAEIKDKLQSLESSCSASAMKAKSEQEEKLKQLEAQLTASCAAETKAAADASSQALTACRTDLADAEQKSRHHVEQYTSLESTVADLKATTNTLQAKLQKAESEITLSQSAQEEAALLLASWAQKQQETESSLNAAELRYQDMESQLTAAAQTLEDAEAKLQAALQLRTDAESQLLTTQLHLKDAQDKLQITEQKQKQTDSELQTVQKLLLDSSSELQSSRKKQKATESKLSSVQQKLESTESNLAKLSAATAARGSDIQKLSSELADAKTKLAEAEAAWIPVRLQKGLVEATAWAKDQYKQASSSEVGQKVLKALDKAKAAVQDGLQKVEPHLEQIKPHLMTAKKTAEDAFKQAKSHAEVLYNQHIKSATWWTEVQQHWFKVERELTIVIMTHLRNAPEPFNNYADPVIVQYLVYTVFLLPLCIVLYLLSSLLFGGSRTPPSNVASAPKKSRTSVGGTTTIDLDGDRLAAPNKAMKKRK